jgi:BlaI family penicillinase repressor
MERKLPDLSRFELQCLRRLWARREATIREVHGDLPKAPSYSTVRKIFERLEDKGAVRRVRLEGKAWVYRSEVPSSDIIRKEIRRLLDGLFDGAAPELVSHLANMDELSVEDLRAVEDELERDRGPRRGAKRGEGRKGA